MRIYITRNARDGLWFNYYWPSGVNIEAVVAKPDKANETALKNVQVDLVKASKFGDGQCLNAVQSELSSLSCVSFPYLFPSGGSAIVMETDQVFLKGDSVETFLQMLNTKTTLNRCLSGSALLVWPDKL